MKAFLLYFLKLCGILILAAAAGFAVSYLAFSNAWGALIAPVALIIVYFAVYKTAQLARKAALKRRQRAVKNIFVLQDGFKFRDLNKNGKLDIYEDPRQSVEMRVEDLLSQMTIEEKIGLMFSPQMNVVKAEKIATKGGFNFGGDIVKQINKNKINTFCATGSLPPREFACWHNAVQRAAEVTRLGIPVTICSDPRHIYVKKTNPLAVQMDKGVSSWPSPLGFGAIRDETISESYGKISAAELRAMGIRFALNPVADTATEPRWGRLQETYGEDAELNGKLASAYVRGMQGKRLGKESVACCVKHFPGGGPQKNGDDPHFVFGKEQTYEGGQFEYHLKPFKDVLKQNVAAVMPYYGVPVGLEGVEEVGFNFNRHILNDLLREKLGFKGVIHSDYSIIEGIKVFGMSCIPGRSWGVEKKKTEIKLQKAVDAGVDQFGGECCVKKMLKAFQKGRISQERIDSSCRRILRMKFELGLFDDPYVDIEHAQSECGRDEYIKAGDDAMRKSIVLLKNNGVLPLKNSVKVYCEGLSELYLKPYCTPVDTVEQADFALVWLDVPKYVDKRDPMTAMFSCGALTYPENTVKRIVRIMQKCPTVLISRLTRPVVMPEFKEKAAAIIADFCVKPEILMEAIFGKFSPSGKLPFDMPLTAEDAADQKSDVPFDCKHKAFSYGDGLTY